MTRLSAAVAVAIAVLMTASCSGKSSSKSATSVTQAATTTAPPASTAAPVTTTVAPTVPPTIATTTTTTTLSPTEVAEAEVRAAWASFSAQSRACYERPTECVPENFDVEPELSKYRAKLERDFISIGRHGEPNPTDPVTTTVWGPIVFSDEGQTASFETCTWDTGILVQDNPRVVLSPEKATIRSSIWMQRRDGRWFVADSRSAGPWVVGRNECETQP
jgi:hypothetical protein